MLWKAFKGLVVVGILLLAFTVAAEAGRQDVFFATLTKDLTPANGQAAVDLLAARIKGGKVTVEDFADYYFRKQPRPRYRPENRKRWIRNMRINFSIINHQSRKHDPQKEILARRAVEVTLFRLKEARPESHAVQ